MNQSLEEACLVTWISKQYYIEVLARYLPENGSLFIQWFFEWTDSSFLSQKIQELCLLRSLPLKLIFLLSFCLIYFSKVMILQICLKRYFDSVLFVGYTMNNFFFFISSKLRIRLATRQSLRFVKNARSKCLVNKKKRFTVHGPTINCVRNASRWKAEK